MTLRIVTHRNWLADHFAEVGGVQDHGFDVDAATCSGDTWWAPGAWIAAAQAAGADIPVLSAGPGWLDALPARIRGRDVFTGTVDECVAATRSWRDVSMVWAKMPEYKSDSAPASLLSLYNFTSKYSVPSGPLQVSAPIPGLHTEARFFCSPSGVSSGAVYRYGGLVWGAEGFDETVRGRGREVSRALAKLRALAVAVYSAAPGPPGYVIDAGMAACGPVVIEANAAWSSNPYDTDPAEALAAIEASHDRDGTQARWRFAAAGVPEPWPRVRAV